MVSLIKTDIYSIKSVFGVNGFVKLMNKFSQIVKPPYAN